MDHETMPRDNASRQRRNNAETTSKQRQNTTPKHNAKITPKTNTQVRSSAPRCLRHSYSSKRGPAPLPFPPPSPLLSLPPFRSKPRLVGEMSPLPKRIRANEVKERHNVYIHSITWCDRTHRGEGPRTTRGTSPSISYHNGDGGPPGRHLGGDKEKV